MFSVRSGLLLSLLCGLALHGMAAPLSLSSGEARHLLVRTGFTPTQAEVDRLVGQRAEQAVDALLAAARAAQPVNPPPPFVALPAPTPYRLLANREEQQLARRTQFAEGLEFKTWWLREMIETPTPLAERMTLFWHNHFATSQQKVVRAQALWQQQQLLRANALGNFRTLLHGVAKNPAMLVYLDGANSRKEAPNENFAREVMELFVLGEATQTAAGLGGYSEQDIKEAARAFTGWSVERDDFSYRFRPGFHDGDSKTLFGQSGNLDGDQALDILLEQPAAPRFIVGKLWREFVSPAADTAVNQADLARAAAHFKASGFDIAQALRDLLLSDSFWDTSNWGSLIKSPVDLVVGTVRQFGFSYTDVTPLVLKSAQLGQNLLVPPNVKGWPGNTDWINATTLLERKRFSEQLFRSTALAPTAASVTGKALRAELFSGAGQRGNLQALALQGRDGVQRLAEAAAQIRFDPERWLETYGGHADQEPSKALKDRLRQILLAVDATKTVAPGTVGVVYLRTLTLDPAYQLK